MSYDISNLSNNSYTNLINNWNNTSTSTSSNNNMLSTMTSLLSENGDTSSSELLTGMMLGLMCSGSSGLQTDSMYGGSEDSSSSGGFNVMLSSLLSAMNEKNQQVKQGLIQNQQSSIDTSISDVVFRQAGSMASTDITTIPEGERINKAIQKASSEYGVSESLIRAIIQVESNYDTNAVSSAGAMGLMQLMPSNVQEYNVQNPFSIEENINVGTKHIKSYLSMYNNDLNMALAAYNFGPGNMSLRGVTSSSEFYKLPTETKNYLVKVNGLL